MLGFFEPVTIQEVKGLLSQHKNAKLLAGGTDLVLEMKREKVKPDYLIYLGKVGELKNITEDNEFISIGSMATFTDVMENKLILKHYNSLFECARNMGSPQIRNAATVGGNIVNAGSAADIVPCIISLGGILVIESSRLDRHVSCESYFKNYATEKVKDNEVLTKIILPKKKELSGYYKLGKRNSLAIARLSTAVSLRIDKEVIKNIAISLGAVGRYPFRATELEEYVKGKKVDALFDDTALDIIERLVYESIKGRKTMPFKKEAVKGVYKEAVRKALSTPLK